MRITYVRPSIRLTYQQLNRLSDFHEIRLISYKKLFSKFEFRKKKKLICDSHTSLKGVNEFLLIPFVPHFDLRICTRIGIGDLRTMPLIILFIFLLSGFWDKFGRRDLSIMLLSNYNVNLWGVGSYEYTEYANHGQPTRDGPPPRGRVGRLIIFTVHTLLFLNFTED